MTWTTLGKDKFQTSYGNDVWVLVSTPKARKPWLLYTERQHDGRPVRQQEIGARDAAAALHAAEVWLGFTARYGLASY
jgi:hypothetical protein